MSAHFARLMSHPAIPLLALLAANVMFYKSLLSAII
jgi:hypothetical protein